MTRSESSILTRVTPPEQFSRDATWRELSPDTMMLPRVAELGITLTLTAAVVGSKKVRGSLLHLQPACMRWHALLFYEWLQRWP